MARERSRKVEADLARLWVAQHALAGILRTADGAPVQVLHPGRPGGGAGPDFRDAVIRFGEDVPRLGDVELHRDARDFLRHGHVTDPAYDRVLLHVVFDAAGVERTPLASGRQVPVVVLDASALDGWPVPAREPCATAIARLRGARVRDVLAEAGLWRLRRKTVALGEAIARDGAAQALYAALAVALGQTANTRAFALLAEVAPLTWIAADIEGLRTDEAACAIAGRLLRAAGLDGALLIPAPALPWVSSGVRPAAHPRRRIAALAHILARLSRLHAPAPCQTREGRRGVRSVTDALVDGADAAVTRAQTGDTARLLTLLTVAAVDGGPALCGRTRAVELAVNALLPWAAARAPDEQRATDILALADRLPRAEPYGATQHLNRNLRDGRGRSLITSALLQQGVLAMHSEWCRRGGCGRCPLS